jgi:hypothetical protein
MGTASESAPRATTRLEENFAGKPFAIGPDHIRRLVEIIERRVIGSSFEFEVKRIDGWLLETHTVNELLDDERLQEERLQSLAISATNKTLTVGILFNPERLSPIEINECKIELSN